MRQNEAPQTTVIEIRRTVPKIGCFQSAKWEMTAVFQAKVEWIYPTCFGTLLSTSASRIIAENG